jgi:hypothetical protein
MGSASRRFLFVAIGGNRGQLAWPQGHCVGGVGLDGQHLHAQHGGKKQERAAAGHGIQHSAQKCGHGEPKPVPVHELGQTGKMHHLALLYY